MSAHHIDCKRSQAWDMGEQVPCTCPDDWSTDWPHSSKSSNNFNSFEPFGDRVLLKRISIEDKYHDIIYLPQTSQQAPQICEVIAIGSKRLIDGAWVEPLCKPGEFVLIGKYSGTEITINDIKYVIVKEQDILGAVHV